VFVICEFYNLFVGPPIVICSIIFGCVYCMYMILLVINCFVSLRVKPL